MKDFFDTIIQMNIYASIAIICVIVLRLIFKSMPKRFVCLLWIVVAVRLVCPYTSESSFSLLNFKSVSSFIDKCSGSNSKIGKITGNDAVTGNGGITLNENKANSKTANSSKSTSRTMVKQSPDGVGFSLKRINYTVVWFVGMMVFILLYIVNYIKISIKLKKIDKTVCDGYFESESISTPFAAGIINPDIYIPKGIEDVEKRYILLHERIHVKNKDCLIKTFGAVLLSVNWFNPLIWLAYKLMCDDLEMRCDEEVIKSMDADVMREYCISIVMHSINSKVTYKIPGVCFAKKSFGGMEVKMRIKNMFSKKVSKSVAVVALVASVFTVTALSTQAKADDKKVPTDDTVKTIENVKKVEEVSEGKKVTTDDTVKTVEEVSEGKKDNVSNEALMKYVKEYQDKGYVLPYDFDEESDDIYLFDKLEANNESINIKFSEVKIENFEIFKEKVEVFSVKDCKVEYSETDDFYEMTVTDDELGYNMDIKYYKEDNVLVFHSTGLQNGVG